MSSANLTCFKHFAQTISQIISHGFQLLSCQKNLFFRLYQQNKFSESKVKFSKVSIVAKGFLKVPNVHMLIKQKSITSQKFGSRDFLRIANSVLNKDKSTILPLLDGSEVLSSASNEAKLFAEHISKNCNLDDPGISLHAFPSRTNLKRHISVTSKMVTKIIMNLDLSMASGPDCIPVVLLKNCEPELS